MTNVFNRLEFLDSFGLNLKSLFSVGDVDGIDEMSQVWYEASP